MANRRILLVEGVDDERVMKHICGNHGIPHLDEIKEHGGASRLLESVPVRIKASEEGDVVGIVIDADTDMRGRWQSIRDRVTTMGYDDAPDAPAPEGTIIDAPEGILLPRLGVWGYARQPDRRNSGELLALSRSTAQCPFGPRGEECGRHSRQKAIIHTWLAWQREPGKPFGTAITERFLDPDVAEARVIASWLRRLFYPDTQAP